MKIDLHVHSAFSKRPANWLFKKIGCAESYTDPHLLYDIAMKKGMDMVTITDHNTIDGCLEIAHRPNTFISSEVTTYFPEDGCKLHILVHDVTEEQFKQVNYLRKNVYDMVDYLKKEGINHALAHPFYSVNNRLTIDHFEKCVLLFEIFELNGDNDEYVNITLQKILSQLNETQIARLVDRHNIYPDQPQPWIKGFLGGSDDHSSLHIARTFTECVNCNTLPEFFDEIKHQNGVVRFNRPSTPMSMALHTYSVAYQYYNNRVNISKYREYNILVAFLDRMLQTQPYANPSLLKRLYMKWNQRPSKKAKNNQQHGIKEVLQEEAQKFIAQDKKLAAFVANTHVGDIERDEYWYRFVNNIGNETLSLLGTRILGNLQKANPFDLFHAIGSAGSLYSLIAPFFAAYKIYGKTRQFANATKMHFSERPMQPQPNIGFFTDTFEEINGVALTLQKYASLANQMGKKLEILTCKKENETGQLDAQGVKYFNSISEYELPEYPEVKLYMPPILELMNYCYKKNFTHIHGVTPGPMGLCGLAIARIMKLPFYTTYHTAMPQYAGYLTGDKIVEDLMWQFMIWFYNQADIVFSPSEAFSDELILKGIAAEKLRLVPRGVEIDRFNPHAVSDKVNFKKGVKMIYVGRVSKEKNMPILENAFKKLMKSYPDLSLVVVGDGPYLNQMKKNLAGLPCKFTGYMEGGDVAAAYASCDLFVFPSTTDTFGNVVLEAQACGLPIIVTDQGGPQENIIPDETGLIVRGNDEAAIIEAIVTLLDNPQRRLEMGHYAREYALTRDYNLAFEQYINFYQKSLMDMMKTTQQTGLSNATFTVN